MRIGLGCVALGSASGPSERAGVRLVHAALDAGVTVFDTADAYGSGASERVLGRALAGRRDEVVIATKGGYRFAPRSANEQRARRLAAPAASRLQRLRAGRTIDHPDGAARRPITRPSTATEITHESHHETGSGTQAADGLHHDAGRPDMPNLRNTSGAYQAQDFSAAHLRGAVQQSLRRLGTDHIDVYQLHGPPRVDPSWLEAAHDLVEAGLVRRVGVGAEDLVSAREWVEHASDGGRHLDVVQLPFGPLDPGAREAVFPEAGRTAVDVWVRGVFGGGVIGLHDRHPGALGPADRTKVAALGSIADELGIDLFELAVAYVRSFPQVSVMVLGTSSELHLSRNVELTRSVAPLTDDTLERISRIDAVIAPQEGSW